MRNSVSLLFFSPKCFAKILKYDTMQRNYSRIKTLLNLWTIHESKNGSPPFWFSLSFSSRLSRFRCSILHKRKPRWMRISCLLSWTMTYMPVRWNPESCSMRKTCRHISRTPGSSYFRFRKPPILFLSHLSMRSFFTRGMVKGFPDWSEPSSSGKCHSR